MITDAATETQAIAARSRETAALSPAEHCKPGNCDSTATIPCSKAASVASAISSLLQTEEKQPKSFETLNWNLIDSPSYVPEQPKEKLDVL